MKTTKWQFMSVILLISLAIFSTNVVAQTQIGGTLSTNTTLGPTGAPADALYDVTSTLLVATGVTLTIQPGVVLKFRTGTRLIVDSGAVLVAQATLGSEIVFTSFADDSFGGDTNGDGSATSPAAGDWGVGGPPKFDNGGGIVVRHFGALTPSAIFDHCIIRYATVGIFAEGGGQTGFSHDGSISLSNTEVSSSLGYPVVTNAEGVQSALDLSNTYLNNGRDAIGTVPSSLTQNATWSNRLPIVVLAGPGVVDIISSSTLTLQPGALLKFQGDPTFLRTRDGGNLVAVGTATSPIVFTSLKDDSFGGDTNGDGSATSPAAGDWGVGGPPEFDDGGGIVLQHFGALAPNAIFDHCIIRYATVGIFSEGGGQTGFSHDGSISLSNTEVSSSLGYPVVTNAEGVQSALDLSNTYLNNGRDAIEYPVA